MTAVGTAFGLTSSAVSQQLATLEHEVRVALLERVGRRVRLTAEGARLVAAEAILRQSRRPNWIWGAGGRGVLEVACFSTFAKAYLLPA
jgi:DNA-binding transcriptional LysR family regulator